MEPAIALLELDSIAVGIRVGDAMVKRAPVRRTFAGTVHPGKYLVYVAGDVASVEEALAAGLDAACDALVDQIFLPDAHPQVVEAIGGIRRQGAWEALGVVETRTVAAIVGAADRGVKGAEVELQEIRLADELGGKAYCLFRGLVADVEIAVELAVESLRCPELLVARVVIPQLHEEMAQNLASAPEFLPLVRAHMAGN